MPRKSKYQGTVVKIPSNVSVDPNGYVYFNLTSEMVQSNDGRKKYNSHKKVLIGKALSDPKSWQADRRMTPNDSYFALFEAQSKDTLPKPPNHADQMQEGLEYA